MKTTSFILLLAIVLSACAPAATPPPTVTSIPPTITIPPPTATVPPPTATVPSATAAVASPPTPATDIKGLSAQADALFQDMTKAGNFSGAVLAARNGQVILSQGYGFADREKKIPNTPQTKFRIGGLTVEFTAMAIMILQEQGKLNAQDTLCTYLTDCPDSWKPITLDQLLSHSSGIPETFTLLPDNTSLEKMISAAKARPLDFKPGGSWNYCNLGYGLLGKVIEAASGQSYEAFLQKNVLEPLQLSSTGYDHGQADLALGYSNSENFAVDPVDSQSLSAFGALYSTVEDLYRWDQALHTVSLVSQKALDSIFTAHVHLPDYPDWGYGYGWQIGPDTMHMFTSNGRIRGYTSVMYHYSADDTTIIVLLNQDDVDEWNTADKVAEVLHEPP